MADPHPPTPACGAARVLRARQRAPPSCRRARRLGTPGRACPRPSPCRAERLGRALGSGGSEGNGGGTVREVSTCSLLVRREPCPDEGRSDDDGLDLLARVELSLHLPLGRQVLFEPFRSHRLHLKGGREARSGGK
eukprot:scaffold20244_cov109-Isochrysis_galbana.AAC.4